MSSVTDLENLPLVSICCITFNHEKYIDQTLEGFLMQKTNFSFEILIHDDASTDATADIIREYEAKYPNIIKPIYQTENQFSKGIRSMYGVFNFPRATGKYIAMCEGDDYWIDENKLQSQADFLEQNEDYGLIHSDLDEYNTVTQKLKKAIWKQGEQNKFQGDIYQQMLRGGIISIYMCTTLFRTRFVKNNIDYADMVKQNFMFGDVPLALHIGRQSKIAYQDKATAVRNILNFSATNGRSFEYRMKFEEAKMKILTYFHTLDAREIDGSILETNHTIDKLNVCYEYKKKEEFLLLYHKLPQSHRNLKLRIKLWGIQNSFFNWPSRVFLKVLAVIRF